MSSYELNRAMHRITLDRDVTMRFRDGDCSLLEGFDLSGEERAAIAERDFPKLWALDAHPIVLFHFSAVLNPREWYIQNVIPAIKGVPNSWYDYYREEGEAARA